MTDDTTEENGMPLMTVDRADGTAECPACAMPLMPIDLRDDLVILECANRHLAAASYPADRRTRAVVANWLAKRGNQIYVQRERRSAEADE